MSQIFRRIGTLERLEPRGLPTGSVESAMLTSTHFETCHPEVDTDHYHFIDTPAVIEQARHFGVVVYDTNHDPAKTYDGGAVFDRCPGDVPPGSGGSETSVRSWYFPEERLAVEAFDMPDSLANPMQLVVNGEIVSADRFALYREIGPGDRRQFFSVTADGFVRPTTLPSNPSFDDHFGLSIGLGNQQETVLPTGETRLSGQINRAVIQAFGLPRVSLDFAGSGSALLEFRRVSMNETRFDVEVRHDDAKRLVVIGANPSTSETNPQPYDVLADFSAVMVQTATNDDLVLSHPARLDTPISGVERVAFWQDVKSRHNPRDPSLSILLGEGLNTDGFGDVALTEAEDGRHNSAEMGRAHASGNGPFDHFTVDLTAGRTLQGMIATQGRVGRALPFLRYSLDATASVPVGIQIAGEEMVLNLPATRDSTPTPGEAWDLFQTIFGSPIVIASDDVDYRVETLSGHVEVDVVGLLFLGDDLLATSLDVNDDGWITAVDALLVIDRLNAQGSGPITGGDRRDTSGDQHLTAVDALLVIDFLNLHGPADARSTSLAIVASSVEDKSAIGWQTIAADDRASPAIGAYHVVELERFHRTARRVTSPSWAEFDAALLAIVDEYAASTLELTGVKSTAVD